MATLDSTDFTPGRPVELAPGVRRLVAPNGGMMTGPGTNTYLLGRQRLVILDPGPAMEAHVEALVQAVGEVPVEAVVVTHTHIDHSPAAAPLAARLGAPLLGCPPKDQQYQDAAFEPTRVVRGGEMVETDIGPLQAVATPGHASNHLCWHLLRQGYLCTGDHILGTVSPVIVHPDGNLIDYLASLERVRALDPVALLPGHGPVVLEAVATIDRLVRHRLLRESLVVKALSDGAVHTVSECLPRVYADVPPALHSMARHTLLAHLVKLEQERRVQSCGEDAWRLL